MSDPQELISRYLNGRPTEGEGAELAQWVRQSASNTQEFALAVFVHQALHDLLRGRAVFEGLQDSELNEALMLPPVMAGEAGQDDAVTNQPAPSLPVRVARPTAGPSSQMGYGKWRLAAVLLLAVVLGAVLWRWVAAPRPPMAVLSSALNAQWEAPFSSLQPGEAVPAQPLYLKAGVAQIRFDSGASMILQAPARFQISSTNAAQLDLGKLSAIVPAKARGFAVQTPGAKVVDLGTEFGTEVREDRSTHVEVFRGTVEAHALLASNSAQATRKLTMDQAAEVGADGASVRPVSPSPQVFVRAEEMALRLKGGTASPHQRWLVHKYQLLRDPALLAYYTFEPDGAAANSSILRNEAPTGTQYDGTIEGATWTEGRCPGKHALAFESPAGRVRVNIPERCRDLTISTWLRIDSYSDAVSGILMSESPGLGLHLQTRDNGLWSFFIAGNQVDSAPGLTWIADPPPWHHLVGTYSQSTGEAQLFLDGKSIAKRNVRANIVQIGNASIGNWTGGPKSATDFDP